jgi:rRNA maturation endonuclease Nob1
MSLALGIVLIIVAAAFVALPFFRQEPMPEAASPRQRGQLERQKLDAYAAIKEAEFDYRMGKLTEADYTALRDKYSVQALEAIAAIEAAQAAPAAKGTESRRPTRIAFCPTCGRGVPPRSNFCAACGRALKDAAA